MIKAEELRIGNLIYFEGELIQLTGVTKGCFYWGKVNFSIIADSFQPIPLTEEWVKKLGFQFTNDDGWTKPYLSIQEGEYRLCILDGEVEVEFDSYKPSHPYQSVFIGYADYVHQLQNLYFCLSRKELTLTDNTTNQTPK